MTWLWDAMQALFTLVLVGGAVGVIYMLYDNGYLATMNRAAKIALMVAGSILAMVTASAINILDVRVICVGVVGVGWVLGWRWIMGHNAQWPVTRQKDK
jgi:hypothetical protein